MKYFCYGLVFESELKLPELPPPPPERRDDPVDVRIVFGAVSESGLLGGLQLDRELWVSDDSMWLAVPGTARYLIRRGREIIVDPEATADIDAIRVYLLGSAFGALLILRGHLVLHGNAVKIGNQCMICVGESGMGKSTLAAGFMQRGFSILADDVVPIGTGGLAIPGFPRIKLWQDTASHLGIDTATLRRILPDMDKFNLPLDQHFADQPYPLRWVYILEQHDQADFRIEEIRGMAALDPLYQNTYRVHFLETSALKTAHLRQCAELAGKIRLVRIARPIRGFNLDGLMDRILADMVSNP